jgi:hypothetical protein
MRRADDAATKSALMPTPTIATARFSSARMTI